MNLIENILFHHVAELIFQNLKQDISKEELIVLELIGDAQAYANTSDSLYRMQYMIDRLDKGTGVGGALINLDLSKAFDRIYYKYLAAVLGFL